MNSDSDEEPANVARRDIIVIGTSAGGLRLLRKLVAGLPEDLDASLFMVMHTAPGGPGYLAEILNAESELPAEFPKDGQKIERGRIYAAPPDHHLLLEPGRIVVTHGPGQSRFRPGIDPLFRSAAAHYGPRVIGVILSGLLDDGVAGLLAVKQSGGVAVVQDPSEAEFPEMILNARRAVRPDFTVSIDAMPELLARLSREPVRVNPEEKSSGQIDAFARVCDK